MKTLEEILEVIEYLIIEKWKISDLSNPGHPFDKVENANKETYLWGQIVASLYCLTSNETEQHRYLSFCQERANEKIALMLSKPVDDQSKSGGTRFCMDSDGNKASIHYDSNGNISIEKR